MHQGMNGGTSVAITIGETIPGEKTGLTKIGETEIGKRSVLSTIGASAKIIQKSEPQTMQLTGATSSAEKDP
jgi:hypothetical protein